MIKSSEGEDYFSRSFIKQSIWIFKSIHIKRRVQLIKLLFLMVACAVSEVVAISSIIPFLAILLDQNKIYNFSILRYFISLFQFYNPILIAGVLIILANIINLMLRLLNIKFSTKISAKIGTDICVKLFEIAINQPYIEHIKMNSSYLINAVNTDIGRMVNTIAQTLQMIAAFIIAIFIIISLTIINFKIAILSFLGFGLGYIFIARFARKRLSRNSYIIAENSRKQVKLIQEVMGSIKEILLYQNQSKYLRDYFNIDFPMRQFIAQNVFLASFPKFVLETFGIILISFLGIILSFDIEKNISIISTLAVFALSAQRLLPSMQQIYLGWSSNKSNHAHITRVKSLIDRETMGINQKKEINAFQFKKSINFSNVDFKYSDKGDLILSNLNFSIRKGDKIGIIGKTGEGKSTLIDLLMGLLLPNNGQITIDNTNISNKKYSNNLMKWQSIISYVPQNIFLKDASFIENIAFGEDKEDVDFRKVKYAAERAKIKVFIEKSNKGFYTKVGERGILLSGGQAQRIALARAFYRDSQILVFDEATSSLDISTESKVTNSIFRSGNDITLIMIAHRLSTLENCDRILFLNNKELFEVSYEESKKLMESLT